METIRVEFLDISGAWYPVQTNIVNRPQTIANSLTQVKRQYPNNRVRAVGMDTGRLYDMLM